METLRHLMQWTPFLVQGMGWNVLIGLVSVLLGTAAGGTLVLLRLSSWAPVRRLSLVCHTVMGHAPTLVVMFYVATLLPASLQTPLGAVAVPLWFKASLALASTSAAFVAWNLHAAVLSWRQGDRATAILFVPNWLGIFIIGVLASTTASLIGVSEVIARAGVAIGASGNQYMLATYAWTCALFVLFCGSVAWAVGRGRRALVRRFSASPACAPGGS